MRFGIEQSAETLTMNPTCRYAITIDTEEQWDWSGPFDARSADVSHISERLPDLVQTLLEHEARPTLFSTYTVMANPASRDAVLAMRKSAHDAGTEVEIGMHLHPWNTPPFASSGRDSRHDPIAESQTYLHQLPDSLVNAKLDAIHARFTDIGLSPTSFRGGRYACGPAALAWLSSHGFKADSSIVPYTSWPQLDGSPDYTHADLTPKRMDGGLWRIPLTRGFTARPFDVWSKRLNRVERLPFRHFKAIAILRRLGVCERVWLNLEATPIREMTRLIPVLLDEGVEQINFTMHSSTLVPGCTPYTKSETDVDRLRQNIVTLLSALAIDRRFVPATMSEIADDLESKHQIGLGSKRQVGVDSDAARTPLRFESQTNENRTKKSHTNASSAHAAASSERKRHAHNRRIAA